MIEEHFKHLRDLNAILIKLIPLTEDDSNNKVIDYTIPCNIDEVNIEISRYAISIKGYTPDVMSLIERVFLDNEFNVISLKDLVIMSDKANFNIDTLISLSIKKLQNNRLGIYIISILNINAFKVLVG